MPTELFVPALNLIYQALDESALDPKRKKKLSYNADVLGDALSLLVYGTFPSTTINAAMNWPRLYKGHATRLPYVTYRREHLLGECLMVIFHSTPTGKEHPNIVSQY